MSFLELALKRSSVRAYTTDPVPEDLLQKVLEAGRIAPSAANFQPWHFIVVRDPAIQRALGDAYAKTWFWQAPVIIVVCVEPARAWTRFDGKNFAWVDGAIAMDHMTLCATDLGLGTCWVGAFDATKVKKTLGIPEGVEPVAMTPLGKAANAPAPKKRKELKDILHLEKW
ncbi:MAG TPA: nitroreductase family protein [Kiritimatiellia bacterium]|nr:nitroreductase family protein [Kiritimatiellia bacterium]